MSLGAIWLMRMIIGFTDKTATLEVIVIGICLGLGLGFAQCRVALKDMMSQSAWNAACIIATLLVVIIWSLLPDRLWSMILDCFNQGCLSASCDVCVTRDTWLIGAALAALEFGLVVAVPTGFVLSRYGSRIYLWIIGCILTAFAAILVGILVITSPSFFVLFLAYCAFLGPTVIGMVTAPFIYTVLKEPPQLAE